MAEVTVGTTVYRSAKLNSRVAFHVARRLAPIIGRMDISRAIGEITGETDVSVLLPLADAIAGMSDTDCDYRANRQVQRNMQGGAAR